MYRHNTMAIRVSPIRLLFPRMVDEADLGGGGIMFMVGGLVDVAVAVDDFDFGFLVVGVGDLAKLSPNMTILSSRHIIFRFFRHKYLSPMLLPAITFYIPLRSTPKYLFYLSIYLLVLGTIVRSSSTKYSYHTLNNIIDTMTTMVSSGGGGNLPMNPSLASALAKHGARIPSSTNSSGDGDAYNNITRNNKTNIQALTVHPSLPRVAYLESVEEVVSTSANANTAVASKTGRGSSKDNNYSQTIVTRRRIVIQQYSTITTTHNNNNNFYKSSNSNHANTNNHTQLIASLPLENLPIQINNFRQSKSKSSKITNQRLTLTSLGMLQTITFLDREALFWQTSRRQYGTNTNLDSSFGGVSKSLGGGGGGGVEEIVLRAESEDDKGGILGQGVCLGLQFTNILVILRIIFDKPPQNNADTFIILCCFEGQRSSKSSVGRGVGSGGGEMKVQYTPTSAAIPITNSIVVYGCSDGAMRFHNLVPSMLYSVVSSPNTSGGLSSINTPSVEMLPKHSRQSTIKSVRGPNGRNDPVVMILNVDPVYNEIVDHSPRGAAAAGGGGAGGGSSDTTGSVATSASDDATLVLHSRLLTVCGSGVAYVWDVHMTMDRSSGALRVLNVLPVSRILSKERRWLVIFLFRD